MQNPNNFYGNQNQVPKKSSWKNTIALVIGIYEFVDLHKTNNNGSANYYSLKLTGEDFVSDGVVQTEPYKSEYEMGIITGEDEAILMNVYSYNMYYCHRNDTSVPKIK